MKVSDLEGEELRYWLAKALGYRLVDEGGWCVYLPDGVPHSLTKYGWAPDIKWEHGGPLIETHNINIVSLFGEWEAFMGDLSPNTLDNDNGDGVGPTPLVAAMRALVASKFGEEVSDERHH